MTLYMSNKLTEVLWSHLSHEATKLSIPYICNASCPFLWGLGDSGTIGSVMAEQMRTQPSLSSN